MPPAAVPNSAPIPAPAPAAIDNTPDPLSLRKTLPSPRLRAASAILVDADSGQVLFEQDSDRQLPMASTTKIMTALLFCENVPETAIITASENASKTRESSLHLKPGETVSAHDLLRAILMRSANDGCVAAAEHVAGTEAAFVQRMNARAAQIGALHTHYANSHGLHSPDHFTTARDLAMIARVAMQEPRIREVVACRTCRISRSISVNDVTLRNHSHFLGHFPGADGVKTGWTVPAGHCYVGSATWHGWRLISVVLHCPSVRDYVQDTAELMKYGFYDFEPHHVATPGQQVGSCTVHAAERALLPVTVRFPVQVVTRKGDAPNITTRLAFENVTAPVALGVDVGRLEAWSNGALICASPVMTMDSTAPSRVAVILHRSAGHTWWWLLVSTILATSLVSLRYGTRYGSRVTAFTKGARRRWRRVTTSLRSDDSGR